MKKHFITIFLVFIIIFPVTSQSAKIGGGIAMGTGYHYNNENSGSSSVLNRSPLFGITFSSTYKPDLPIHFSPSFTYFIPRTNTIDTTGGSSKTRISSMMFNIDGHYVIYSPGRFEFYVLAGFNIHFTKIKWLSIDYREKDNAFGMNVGCGSSLKLSEKISIYTEAKYTLLSRYDQLIFNAGLLVNIDQ